MSGPGARAVAARYATTPEAASLDMGTIEALAAMLGRASCRSFRNAPVPLPVLRAVGAAALAAPSKSDLQQRDVIVVRDPSLLDALKALLARQGWIAAAPALLVFCANNRRQRRLHDRWGRPFANDHLDAFFNAAFDAGIALSAAVLAAEAAGLGCCPISTIRDEADRAGDLLGLPDHVLVAAALAVGWPAEAARPISPRLPLGVTLHLDRYDETGLDAALDAYDARRARPGAEGPQRDEATFGRADPYTWSDEKTRQYARPERAGFGDHVRRKGFVLR